MSSSTSIGRGPAHGSNENHDGDPLNKTLGEKASPEEPPVGNDVVDQGAPDVPVPGGAAKPGISQGPQSCPDGPNVEAGPWKLHAAKGMLPHG